MKYIIDYTYSLIGDSLPRYDNMEVYASNEDEARMRAEEDFKDDYRKDYSDFGILSVMEVKE